MIPHFPNMTDNNGKEWRMVPICTMPNCINSAHRSGTNNNGIPIYRTVCYKHHQQRSGLRSGSYTKHKKGYCENTDGRLGITCAAPIITQDQLEVDHIDGDHSNDSPDNLQTLCANCHRIKTSMEQRGCLVN